jgi:hypothetical protein
VISAGAGELVAAKAANAREGDPAGSRIPEVHIGSKEALASGNFVMKSQNFATQLKDQIHPGLRAVEMEAKGLFDAVRGRKCVTTNLLRDSGSATVSTMPPAPGATPAGQAGRRSSSPRTRLDLSRAALTEPSRFRSWPLFIMGRNPSG